jgi:putative FmdB family regulatory protein
MHMPAYDFRCKECRHTFTLDYQSYQAFEEATPACPQCGSTDLSHLIRRVALLTDEDTRLERLADPARLAGLDEGDPRTMGRLMREMAQEAGEPLDAEMADVVNRLESGESPESIEQSLPDMGSGDGLLD